MGRYLERARKVVFIPVGDGGRGAAAETAENAGEQPIGDDGRSGASETATGRVPAGMPASVVLVSAPGRDEAKHVKCQDIRFFKEWPPECMGSQNRFGQRHARLFPLLGRVVSTLSGPGVLVQVSANRATVELAGSLIIVNPDEVLPLELAAEGILADPRPNKAMATAALIETTSASTGADSESRSVDSNETSPEDRPQEQMNDGPKPTPRPMLSTDLSVSAAVASLHDGNPFQDSPVVVAQESSDPPPSAPVALDDGHALLRWITNHLKGIKQRMEAGRSLISAKIECSQPDNPVFPSECEDASGCSAATVEGPNEKSAQGTKGRSKDRQDKVGNGNVAGGKSGKSRN